jgi:hypothetical protein
MLSADLKEADPQVYEIIERVRISHISYPLHNSLTSTAGETQAEALYQSHTIRKLYFTIRAGCAGECHAE